MPLHEGLRFKPGTARCWTYQNHETSLKTGTLCNKSLRKIYVTDSKAGGVIPSKSFDSEAPDNNKHESLGHGLALLDFGLLLVESFLIVFSFGMAMRVFCHLMLDVSNFFFDFSNDHSELIIFVSQETLHFWRVFSCL